MADDFHPKVPDIVNRLRWPLAYDPEEWPALMREAADEIIRLRAQWDERETPSKDWSWGDR